ncbi:hypothetical protein RRG08_043904 [Elysia crispata]|uniref:Uncharacterized protein n=1 Tax=Elysia crispata TaxID=231223 RepID=A0AAE1CRQ3_9GAST|nr:hypothetical protein RRG08_043904 [Elysia crispata]
MTVDSVDDEEPIVPQHSISNDDNNPNLRHLLSSDDAPSLPQSLHSLMMCQKRPQSSHVPTNGSSGLNKVAPRIHKRGRSFEKE